MVSWMDGAKRVLNGSFCVLLAMVISLTRGFVGRKIHSTPRDWSKKTIVILGSTGIHVSGS